MIAEGAELCAGAECERNYFDVIHFSHCCASHSDSSDAQILANHSSALLHQLQYGDFNNIMSWL